MDYKEHLKEARESKRFYFAECTFDMNSGGVVSSMSGEYEDTIKQLESDLKMATDAIFKFKKQEE